MSHSRLKVLIVCDDGRKLREPKAARATPVAAQRRSSASKESVRSV
jgi:hypothetical protein